LSRVGRPRRFKAGIRVTSFYIPIESEEIIEKMKKLAQMDGISLSEKILEAMTEYVGTHFPGNPTLPLQVFTGEAPMPLRLQAKFDQQELQRLLPTLEKKQGEPSFRKEISDKCKMLTIKLARVNMRLKQDDITKLVDKAVQILEEK